MKYRTCSIFLTTVASLIPFVVGTAQLPAAPVRVEVAYSDDTAFETKTSSTPATNDAATGAAFKIVAGDADENSSPLDVLHDGRIPSYDDEPQKNFFFSTGGRILVDLGKSIDVATIASYSWHSGARAPQVYDVYAADGTAKGFNTEPAADVKPPDCGWTSIARVDTSAQNGGQHAVSITPESGKSLGNYRYVLFDIKVNPKEERFNATFFSEIDITDANGPALTRLIKPKRIIQNFSSKDGKFKYLLDATEAPDLQQWCAEKLIPEMDAWYPKIIAMLPVEGFTPSHNIKFTLKESTHLRSMKGVPAFATGNGVYINAKFARDEQAREAIGAGIHEVVHVVQFGGKWESKRADNGRPPSWVFEGVADYIRWFLYEPQSKGAEITARNVGRAKYNDSYRVTANFFDWVIKNHEKDLMRKLNVATHNGYSDDLWKEWTGKTLEELGAEWKKENMKRLGLDH